MATDQARPGPVFSSPTMKARAAALRVLALVDELERAQARRDVVAVGRLAGAAHDHLTVADDALYGLFLANASVPADVPPGMTETEERALWGDR